MARKTGYILNVKLFIETPKNDFKAQAEAATLASEAVEKGEVTKALIDAAEVVEITGKAGSIAVE